MIVTLPAVAGGTIVMVALSDTGLPVAIEKPPAKRAVGQVERRAAISEQRALDHPIVAGDEGNIGVEITSDLPVPSVAGTMPTHNSDRVDYLDMPRPTRAATSRSKRARHDARNVAAGSLARAPVLRR